MSFIEMDHIRKSFGNLEVIKDVSLHVETGEVVSIIGRPGAARVPSCAVFASWKPSTAVPSSSTVRPWPVRRPEASVPSMHRLPTFGLSVAAWACAFSTSTCFRI